MALDPEQVAQIQRAFESQRAERYRAAESETALLLQIQKSNASLADDEELLPLTSRLARVSTDARQLHVRQMQGELVRILRPDQRVILSQLVTGRRLDIE